MGKLTQMGHQPHRVEFRLSMPDRASWDGEWSGSDRNYAVVRELSDEQLGKLFDHAPRGFDLSRCRNIWTYRFPGGWAAQVSARVVLLDEELPRSDGFSGYEWMIDNILATGSPCGGGGVVVTKDPGQPEDILMSFDDLSSRQQAVAILLALGLPTREVAARLGAKLKTIDSHRRHVLNKFSVRNAAELARISIHDGWTSMHDEVP